MVRFIRLKTNTARLVNNVTNQANLPDGNNATIADIINGVATIKAGRLEMIRLDSNNKNKTKIEKMMIRRKMMRKIMKWMID